MMDLNGDRYPDIVQGTNVYISTRDGSLSSAVEDLSSVFSQIRMESYTSASYTTAIPPLTPPSSSSSSSSGSGSTNSGSTTEGGTSGGGSAAAAIVLMLLPSPSPTATVSRSSSETTNDLLDVNGDGLPDLVYTVDGTVYARLNTGYSFSSQVITLGTGRIRNTKSYSESNGLGLSWPYGSFSCGIGNSSSENYTETDLIDVNGDGLPDRVYKKIDAKNIALDSPYTVSSDPMMVEYNTGKGFAPAVPLRGMNPNMSYPLSESDSSVENDQYAYTIIWYRWIHKKIHGFRIKIPWPVLRNPGRSFYTSDSATDAGMMDFNGDGLPDYFCKSAAVASATTTSVSSFTVPKLSVYLNTTGKTNLLKSVTRPLGSTVTLEYARSKNSVQCPQSKWTMSASTISDGMGNSYKTSYSYENPVYDRKERESYGFQKVTQTQPDGSTIAKEYSTGYDTYTVDGTNNGYYTKGLERKETIRGANSEIATITENTYTLVAQGTNGTSNFPSLTKKTTLNYAGISTEESGTHKTLMESYSYDSYGNVTAYTRQGDTTIHADITYTAMTDSYIMGKPVRIQVTDESGNILRKRTGVYDSLGNLRKLTQGDSSEIELNYDSYGNITQFISPANNKGQRYTLNYTYDGSGMYVTQVRDSFGYTSKSQYNYVYGVPTCTTDTNGNMMSYSYDEYGRQTKVYAPDDMGTAQPTLSMSYDIESVPAKAVTKNKGLSTSSATIDTVLYTDGLKRVLQTKKEMEVAGKTGYTASGKIEWDNMGREVSQGQPYFTDTSAAYVAQAAVNPTTTQYDGIGRVVKKSFPDNTTIKMDYALDSNLERVTTTDQNGHKKESYKDDRGNIVKVREYNDGDAIETTYTYDAMSQITKITDAKNNATTCTYDELGRRLTIQNPDTGLTEYTYDDAGNMVLKVTPNVRMMGKSISYTYNYNRLEKISYPQMNNVYYTYGAAGAASNGAGRIIAVDNGDVKETRKYGTLGEMTESTKIITATSPTIKQTSYTTKYTWDSMGRLHRLVYPDGEILDYTYDNGGLLKKAVGTVGSGAISRAEGTIEYVKDIQYDAFGQRTTMTLGNGDVTTYAYNPQNRRLTNLSTKGTDGTVWQNLSYRYDDVGNITKINNEDYITCDAKKKTTTQSYSYDDLDRLVEANGNYSHETWLPYYTDRINSYTSSFSYDSIGNILNKNQKNVGTYTDGSTKTLTDTTYDWDYKYTSTRPHAVTQTGTLFYTYDASGNMTKKTDTNTNASTVFTWNEENRLTQTVATTTSTTDTATTTYKYDDTGTRIAKKGANGETIYVNTNYSIKDEQLESTHIFAGQTRIATKLTMLTTKTTTTDMGVYYYHPDHIGSASTVTDNNGKFTEHCEYFPYGEVWISESASTSVTSLLPFKFTSKELDSETGLYYYGARYMDPKLGRWLSTDAVLDTYLDGKLNNGVYRPSNLSLYMYCSGNPIMLIDPDGNTDSTTQWYKNNDTPAPAAGCEGGPKDASGMSQRSVGSPANGTHGEAVNQKTMAFNQGDAGAAKIKEAYPLPLTQGMAATKAQNACAVETLYLSLQDAGADVGSYKSFIRKNLCDGISSRMVVEDMNGVIGKYKINGKSALDKFHKITNYNAFKELMGEAKIPLGVLRVGPNGGTHSLMTYSEDGGSFISDEGGWQNHGSDAIGFTKGKNQQFDYFYYFSK